MSLTKLLSETIKNMDFGYTNKSFFKAIKFKNPRFLNAQFVRQQDVENKHAKFQNDISNFGVLIALYSK